MSLFVLTHLKSRERKRGIGRAMKGCDFLKGNLVFKGNSDAGGLSGQCRNPLSALFVFLTSQSGFYFPALEILYGSESEVSSVGLEIEGTGSRGGMFTGNTFQRQDGSPSSEIEIASLFLWGQSF